MNIIEDAWMWAVTQLRKVVMLMSGSANEVVSTRRQMAKLINDVGDLDHEILLGMAKNNENVIIIHVT